MADQFKLLFSPLKVGSMTIPNRIMVPGHWPGMRYYPQEFLPDDRLIGYWESKAKGGVGIVTTGIWGVHPSALWYTDPKNPRYVESLKKAADAVKRHGTCFLVQLWHGGNQTSALPVGAQQWSSSATPSLTGNTPHAMTTDEVKEVIEGFASTAALVQKAGVDGVELHAAHGYLFSQFMSPHINKRTDEYGGDMEGRMRFTLEVIDAVRAAVGSDFVVGIRFNGDMFVPGGYTLDDMKIMAPMMTRTGKLDYVNVSTGGPQVIAPMYFPLGHSVYQAAAIKQVVDVPVACVGRVIDPVQAENILAENQADILAMNRATICDPEMPKKAREGRLEEIRKCMGCSEGCWQRVTEYTSVQCCYNPTVGRETEPGWLELIPAETKKKVMVVGGGPAGLETARVAAARGHQVSLWEKGDDLGGLILVAMKAPGRDGFEELPRYYKYQMKLLGVDVHLNSKVTVDMVKKENPDVVVVATGSLPYVPDDIIGVDQDNVVNNVRDVLTGEVEVGENVLIVDFHPHIQGLSTADFLAQQGKKVELVTARVVPGDIMETLTRTVLFMRLGAAGVKISPNTAVMAISGNTVKVIDVYSGQQRDIEGIDTVILSYGGVENNELYYALKGQVKELYAVGDCKGVRKLMWATDDAAKIGRMI